MKTIDGEISAEMTNGAVKYGTQRERIAFWNARIADPAIAAYAHLTEMTSVLAEEAGESVRAVLHNEGKERIRAEVIQVISVGYAILESLTELGDTEPRKRIRE